MTSLSRPTYGQLSLEPKLWPDRLKEIVQSRRRCYREAGHKEVFDPDGSVDICEGVTDDFLCTVEQTYPSGVLKLMGCNKRHSLFRNAGRLWRKQGTGYHVLACIVFPEGRFYVDWAPRQLDCSAPVPVILRGDDVPRALAGAWRRVLRPRVEEMSPELGLSKPDR